MRRLRARRHDSGFSLVELLVAMSIGVIVLLIVGGVFFRTLITQRDVTSLSHATDSAQTAASALERSVRNATAVDHRTNPSGVEILLTRTRTGSAGNAATRCEAYAYDPSAHTLRHTTSAAAIDYSSTAGWGLLLEGVSPVTGSELLPVAGAGATRQVAFSFSVDAGEVKPVHVDSVIFLLPSADTGSTPCF